MTGVYTERISHQYVLINIYILPFMPSSVCLRPIEMVFTSFHAVATFSFISAKIFRRIETKKSRDILSFPSYLMKTFRNSRFSSS